jgi:hypothetical protein
MLNDYYFVTHWCVPGRVEDVYEVLRDGRSFHRWWPSVFLEVQEDRAGDDNNVGQVLTFRTRGWMPYTLEWSARVVEMQAPHKIMLEASGDLNGRGEWSLQQDGQNVDAIFEWEVENVKPIVRYLSPLLKPLFESNHTWAMRRGKESLMLELCRRTAQNEVARHIVPAPPRAYSEKAAWVAICGAAVMLAGVGKVLFGRKLSMR